MSLSNKDAASLWDMSVAIAEIVEDTAGLSYREFGENRLVRRAVERNLMILGEAANRVSQECRLSHGEIDWRGIIGLRNILAHQYEKVRHEILWDVVTNILGSLNLQLRAILESLGEG